MTALNQITHVETSKKNAYQVVQGQLMDMKYIGIAGSIQLRKCVIIQARMIAVNIRIAISSLLWSVYLLIL
ncbi:hypothetical protein RAS_p710 (plasmid) [Rickettsia asiatica]|uniref:Uncharacterized protein n=2 Tax=spotted fever group TaxID=114277 RepID=A0A9N7BVW0_RICCR|nr:hypothetical protein UQ52_07730 [Rickettsia conorii subsp. raoultii]BBJ32475.1 hypothetical protein RAS_p710 [Rickettsia asiatica]